MRIADSQAITTNLAPGDFGTYFIISALSGVDWNNMHAVVIVDYKPNPTERPTICFGPVFIMPIIV